MDALSGREKEIMTILFKASSYVSADEMANDLQVSNKTIYRDLQSIEKN